MKKTILDIENLNISFQTSSGRVDAVRNLTFSLAEGESLGVVGESGCGKSLTNLAIMGLLPPNAIVTADKLQFLGEDLLRLNERTWQKIRGEKMGMIFQDPLTALNPCYTVQHQIEEVLKVHTELDQSGRKKRCLELLDLVGIPDPESRLKAYPHELSGGMAQRVMIAMSLSCHPTLLIADEPTTALDVTIQDQILRLIKKIQEKEKMALILVTHDIGVVAQNTERLQVMYAGEIVEEGLTNSIISQPKHPYSYGLLNSLPSKHQQEFRGRLPSITGMVPDLKSRPRGCQFHPRCPYAFSDCQEKIPTLIQLVPETNQVSRSRCHLPQQDLLGINKLNSHSMTSEDIS